ncbi:MAG: pilus assembly protein PilP [Gammaproteobacteria bacterium]
MSGVRRGHPRSIAACSVLGMLVLLAGCGDESGELRGWMDEVRASVAPVPESIAEPKRFEPFRYGRVGQADPFAQSRLGGLPIEAPEAAKGGGLRPETHRPREVLEGYPLDAIRMVGHLSNGRQSFALLQVDNTVHQARVGNHAGQDFGLITKVSESEVRLRELVQDASGDWVHRETVLQLQEGESR